MLCCMCDVGGHEGKHFIIKTCALLNFCHIPWPWYFRPKDNEGQEHIFMITISCFKSIQATPAFIQPIEH